MNFKVEIAKPNSNKTLKTGAQMVPALPALAMKIESIVCLNYSIQMLASVVESHFDDDDSCPANLLVRALKVISISMKDSELRIQIERILENNRSKREKLYFFFVYWASFANNLSEQVLQKLDRRILFTLIASIFSAHCFLIKDIHPSISRLVDQFFKSELASSPEAVEKIAQNMKNQFIELGCPFVHFMRSVAFLHLKNPAAWKFLQKNVVDSIIKTRQSAVQLFEICRSYLNSKQDRNAANQFFFIFDNLSPYFVESMLKVLDDCNPVQILQMWSNNNENKFIENMLRTSVKQWISKNNANYWRIFESCYNTLEHRRTLLAIGEEIENEKLLNECIIREYYYNFFLGMNFELEKQNQFVEQMSKRREASTYDVCADMIKAMSHCSSRGNVNIMCVNKLHQFKNWNKFELEAISKEIGRFKTKNVSESFKTSLENLKANYEKLEGKYSKKNQKCELAYHVITIQFEQGGEKCRKVLAYEQLIQFVLGKLGEGVDFRSQYGHNYEAKKQQSEKKEIFGIVVEAHLVRALKKVKGKVEKQKLIALVSYPQKVCYPALQRLVSKGIIQQTQNQYQYLA